MRFPLSKCLTLCAAVCVCGCSFTDEPDVSVLDARPLWDSHVEEGRPDGERVAPKLGEQLMVTDAVAIALANNADIGEAQARLLRSRRLILQARAAFLPSLDIGGGYTRIWEARENDFGGAEPRSGSHLYAANAQVSYNVFSGGRDLNNLRIARDNEKSAGATRDRVDQQVRDGVRRAFYESVLARESISIARASVAFSSRELKDARARFEVGRGLKTDVLTFETRVLEAEVDVSSRTNAHRLARLALAELMAVTLPDDTDLVAPDLSENRWERMPDDQVVARSWEARADLEAIRSDYAAALRDVHVARSEFYPQMNASVEYDMQRLSSPGFDHDDDQFLGRVSVDWNLFAGGATRAAVRAAQHQAEEIAEQHRGLKLQIRTEISNALRNIEDARNRVQLGEKTVASSEENLRLITERYRAGAITITQVTESELRLTDARLTLIQAKTDLLNALSELDLALGEQGPEGGTASNQ